MGHAAGLRMHFLVLGKGTSLVNALMTHQGNFIKLRGFHKNLNFQPFLKPRQAWQLWTPFL